MDVELVPVEIPEWAAEDLIAGHLSAQLEVADPEQAKAMLDGVRLALPPVVDHRELVAFSAQRGTPLDESLAPDLRRFDFHLIELPLSVLVPPAQRMVRLRLCVHITADGAEPAVAYDLFPRDQWTDVAHDLGEVSVDVAKGLTFVSPALGGVLGLKLAHPLRWSSRTVRVRTSDRLSNPVEWYVTDRSVNEGFTAYLIVRTAKGVAPTLRTTVACELRRAGPAGRMRKATYLSGDHVYELSHG